MNNENPIIINSDSDLKFWQSYCEQLALNVYREKPVSFREFLINPRYIGKSTEKEGIPGKGIYPGWWKYLDLFMQDDERFLITLTGGIGIGKCKRHSSLQQTSLGLLKMSDVYQSWVDGNRDIKVLTEDGIHSVYEVVDDGVKEGVEIELEDGNVIEPGIEHRYRVLDSDYNLEWRKAKDIQVGDYLIYSGLCGKFPEKDTMDDWVPYEIGINPIDEKGIPIDILKSSRKEVVEYLSGIIDSLGKSCDNVIEIRLDVCVFSFQLEKMLLSLGVRFKAENCVDAKSRIISLNAESCFKLKELGLRLRVNNLSLKFNDLAQWFIENRFNDKLVPIGSGILKEDTIAYLLRNDCSFVKVKSIKQFQDRMIDLAVEGSPTYVSDGLITHNTTIAAYAVAYILYLVLNMRDPWAFFEVNKTGPFAVAFFCLTYDEQLGTKAFRQIQTMLQDSEWFMSHPDAKITGTKIKKIYYPNIFTWIFSTPERKGYGVQGEDVITGILDEVDDPKQTLTQKKKVLDAFNSVAMRFASRFAKRGFSRSRLFIVSSKQDELGFLEEFIDGMRNDPRAIIVDEPQWNILSDDNYSGEMFEVMVGDSYNPSKILTTSEEKEEAIRDGFRIIQVPIEMLNEFKKDLIQALRDRAGVTVAGSRKHKLFPSSKDIKFDETKDNPVKIETIYTGLKDETSWVNHIDLSKLRATLDVPRYIHFDMSIAEDSSGLACSHIAGWTLRDKENEDGTFSEVPLPIIETDFILRVKAKKKDRIPLNKMRQTLFDLKRKGLNIRLVSADLRLLSEDTIQILNRNGLKAEYFSVDRNVQSNVDFRNLMQEERWLCHRHEWFFIEAKNIEWDRDAGKVDHPDKIKVVVVDDGVSKELVVDGSKDVFDAVVGSAYHCMANAKRYVNVGEIKKALQSCVGKQKLVSMSDDWLLPKTPEGAAPMSMDSNIEGKEQFLKDAALTLRHQMNNNRKINPMLPRRGMFV